MTGMINAVEAVAAPSGSGLDVVMAPVQGIAAAADSTQTGQDVPADAGSVGQAVDALSEQLAGHDVALSYHVDADLGRVIVEVIDRKDGSVLRQIPGEEAVRLARLMKSGQGGLLQAQV